MMGFALAACVAAGIVFGLVPALELSRGGVAGGTAHDLLRSGSRVASGAACAVR